MAEENSGGPRRVHYFNGQLLDASDFTAEQDYHVDMRRRLNRSMHGTGVAGDVGLRVRKEGDKRLRIGAGVAIDAQGREIVLVADRLIDLDAVKAKAGTTVFLTLAYDQSLEVEVRDAGTASAVNHRRTAEEPRIDFVAKKPPDGGDAIALAAITIDAGGNIAEVDNTVRGFVGSVIDPKADLAARTLATSGAASVAGALGVGTGAPVARLDIQQSARTGAHPPAVNGLYVTGDFGTDRDGVEFRHSNGAQGIGLGSTTIYAAGTAADQDLGLKPRGKGKVNVSSDAQIRGNLEVAAKVSVGADAQVGGNLTVGAKASVGADLQVGGNLLVTRAQVPVVTSVQEQSLRIIHGVVLKTSRPVAGAGYIVSKPENRPGIFDILFRPFFSSRPSGCVTQIFPEPDFKKDAAGVLGKNDGGDPRDNAVIVGIDHTMMRVKLGGATGIPDDRDFSFVVVGPM